MSSSPHPIKAVIFGLAGTELTEEERSFFASVRPAGFILFKRNCDNPEQIKKLNKSLRDCVSWHAPILIDQEGGRVARLGPPHWRKSPPAGDFAKIAETDIEAAKKATYENAVKMAEELEELGINVDCAPMADILFPECHDIVGDRSFGSDPEIVATLAGEMARGLTDGGVMPVLKHIPGHGRAKCDSHESLPVVDASRDDLDKMDFVPFSKLNKLPWGMTAHITYTAIDPENPATLSKKVIDVIRNKIGFKGILLTDDLSMKALKGSYAQRTKKSIEAGCDIVLHCNGKMEEMQEVANACPELSPQVKQKLAL